MKKTTEKYIWNTENKKYKKYGTNNVLNVRKGPFDQRKIELNDTTSAESQRKRNRTRNSTITERKKNTKQNGRKLAKAAKTTNTQIDEGVTPKRFEEPRKWNVYCLFKSIVSNENPFSTLCCCVYVYLLLVFSVFEFSLHFI